MPVTYRYSDIAGTIAVDEGLGIADAAYTRIICEESPALIYYNTIVREGDARPRRIEQLRHHSQRNACNQVAEMIDVEDMRLDCSPMAEWNAHIEPLQIR